MYNQTSFDIPVSTSSPSNQESWTYFWVLLAVLYPLVCALLRNDRLRTTLETFPYTTRRSFASMTDNDAMQIQQALAELEFPFLFEKSLQFALFRSYGIPTVSKLLVATSQFTEPSTACKRYTDTEVLVTEIIANEPAAERTREALGRMNYIHSQYRKSGKILDDDMLYTISLFASEPVRWIDRYEWRKLEDFEKCAIGTFWKSVGDAMEISWEKLKSGTGGTQGTWKDGLHFWEELTEWSLQYEQEKMVPDPNVHKTAEETIAILLWGLPNPLKPVGRHLVSALMGDRLRTAMMYPDPPAIYHYMVTYGFTVRKYLLRYLSLPRPSFLRHHHITELSENGTYYYKRYEAAPYYVKPTLWKRWKPAAWLTWLMGLPLPGDEGDKYSPEGYRIPEIGPRSMKGKGGDYASTVVEGLRTTRTGGCVFAAKTQ